MATNSQPLRVNGRSARGITKSIYGTGKFTKATKSQRIRLKKGRVEGKRMHEEAAALIGTGKWPPTLNERVSPDVRRLMQHYMGMQVLSMRAEVPVNYFRGHKVPLVTAIDAVGVTKDPTGVLTYHVFEVKRCSSQLRFFLSYAHNVRDAQQRTKYSGVVPNSCFGDYAIQALVGAFLLLKNSTTLRRNQIKAHVLVVCADQVYAKEIGPIPWDQMPSVVQEIHRV